MKKFVLGVGIVVALAMGVSMIIGGADNSEFKSGSKDSSNSPSDGSLPGIGKFDSDLLERFKQKQKERRADYKPRTRHLDGANWAKYTNRLFLETSPYLLQHAHNPVNWYPWGDEAFKKAKELGRPVLLSVGYSTCH